MKKTAKSLFLITFICLSNLVFGQFVANYDESKVPEYSLPELLVLENGKKVKTAGVWENKRRPEILELFQNEVFGKVPDVSYELSFQVIKDNIEAINGKAILKEVEITVSTSEGKLPINVLFFIPKSNKPVPLFLTLNFYGNQSIHPDKNISLAKSWLRNNEEFGITENKSNEATRGVRAYRWEVEEIIDNGLALATIYYGDIDPDFDDGFKNGIHGILKDDSDGNKNDNWGSIAAWAWGLSRAMDYIVTDADFDKDKVAVMGHSRLGKAALWAGATDKRFALTISNDSGCGGAALSRRKFGETVWRINDSFPHWFCGNFKKYSDQESNLPVDQHMLIALMAPRAIYVASAEDDQWADPRGEYLSTYYGSQVYKLFNEKALSEQKMPNIESPVVASKVGYHIRKGKHDVTPYDWQQYISFARSCFGLQ
ncbi:alpha/beta hydrolase [Flexithrix dorotheae]|uniref:glucuronyl esterase domain-containing protein n=1 Tax=Flexithrix dorotheae TaxID=70993 RepID=UPI0003810B08|nr:alpha/beta hydrolase [Flexithrix dorotheae]